MRYEFTDDLITGNEIIDNDHRTLLKATDNLMLNIARGNGKDTVDQAITFLLEYAKEHFLREEELQSINNYPAEREHKKWHFSYILALKDLQTKLLCEGTSEEVVVELTKAIGELVSHIKTYDKKLSEFLQKK